MQFLVCILHCDLDYKLGWNLDRYIGRVHDTYQRHVLDFERLHPTL